MEQNDACFSVVAYSSEEYKTANFGSMQMYRCGKGRHTHSCTVKRFQWPFSVTVQRNYMKLGMLVAADTVSLCMSLGPYNSFSFGVVSILLLRF